MVNFYNDYVTCSKTAKLSDVAGKLLLWPWQLPQTLLNINIYGHFNLSVSICFILMFTASIIAHFDHIKKVAGADIIGFGGDYDGVTRWVQNIQMMTWA